MEEFLRIHRNVGETFRYPYQMNLWMAFGSNIKNHASDMLFSSSPVLYPCIKKIILFVVILNCAAANTIIRASQSQR